MRPVLLALLLFASAAPAAAQGDAAARFKALYTREWAWRTAQAAGGEDDTDTIRAKLPDVSPAVQAAKLRYLEQVRRELAAIPAAALSPADRDNRAVYQAQIDALVERLRFRDYEKPLNADSAFWSDFSYTARRPFRGEADYRAWIAQMNDLPRYFTQQTANLRAGLARGFTPPRVTLEGRDASIASVADARPQDTVFFEPFKAIPAAIPTATQAALRAQAEAAIAGKVQPAYKALLGFMRTEYLPKARTTLGAYQLPDGRNYYASLIREFVTIDMSADAIHTLGLAEVAKIRAQMEQTKRDAKFAGDLPAFLAFLRTDPQFYPKTGEALLREAAWIAKQFDAKAGDWFGHLPRQRFAIRPVPADLAPYYTSGRGGPGVYLLNTYNLPARPWYALRALTLHESAPGHAFQMPLSAENTDQPDFRRKVYISAYGEGWALYCEKLGVEMGMYETPYDTFGMLSYQAWRAARLVVDTGIHAKGWSREQAQRYMRDNTALADHEITTEVDRYIAWPGQALSYYMGQMAIERGRAKAETALGARFDIRAFHDMILSLGSVPLPVIDANVDRFIAGGGKGPYPAEE